MFENLLYYKYITKEEYSPQLSVFLNSILADADAILADSETSPEIKLEALNKLFLDSKIILTTFA